MKSEKLRIGCAYDRLIYLGVGFAHPKLFTVHF